MSEQPAHGVFDGPALQYERAVNERYQRELRDMIDSHARIVRSRSTTRNQQWTDPSGPTPIPAAVVGPLAGRVALGVDDDMVPSDFYIGPWHQEWGHVFVVSWAAPVASLFYSGHNSNDPLAGEVTARRTFVAERSDIVAIVDEVEPAGLGHDPFAKANQRRLIVPPAPVSLPKTPQVVERLPGEEVVQPSPQGRGEPTLSPWQRAAAPLPTGPRPVTSGSTARPASRPNGELRAEEALRTILERPRTGELAPVLATLQPEQYRLVTWPDTVPLVIQGHPGSGKTVIATHRAVYLTHQDREAGPVGRVALVGPTDRHADHVRKVIRDLDARNVRVLSLPHFLAELAGLRTQPAPTNEQRRLDTDWSLGRLVDRAVPILREAGRLRPRGSSPSRVLVDALTKHDPLLTQLVEANHELSEWLAQVGSFERASTSERFLPFLAAAAIALTPLAPATQFDHLIVDEAQDVRPLEWRILTATLHHPERVSLLGDINQRRSDWSPMSWLQLVTDLGLTDEQGRFETQVLDIGFRTTREVLRFANQLLPQGERVDRAIRTGQRPTVLPAASGELAGAVVRESRALSARYPEGLVAVITMVPKVMSDKFRKSGWKRAAMPDAWTDSERTVLVLHPASARGLEFDGVVVVEPADFPPNVGRLGLLFTSLTRAVQELVVLHSRPLPKDLRSRSR